MHDFVNMQEAGDYHTIRIIKRDERENILYSLGLIDVRKLFVDGKPAINCDPDSPIRKRKSTPLINETSLSSPCRRSLRAKPKSFEDYELDIYSKESVQDSCHCSPKKKFKSIVPNKYGCLEGVSVGDSWKTRLECSRAGVHRPTVAGIHSGKKGAYSVAISGDYEDDQDNGYCFTYTGAGGRDLTGNHKNLRRTPQTKDQSGDGANSSLIRNIETRFPVRVIRGYKLKSPFAPGEGYRYDGLYTVEKYWTCAGKAGFLVYKFLMKRCESQPPAPWDKENAIPRERIKIVKLRKKSSIANNTPAAAEVSTDMRSCVNTRSNSATTSESGNSASDDNDQLIRTHSSSLTNINNNNGLRKPCIIKYRKSTSDDSNKENSVIIRRHSVGVRRNRSDLVHHRRFSLNQTLSNIRKPEKRGLTCMKTSGSGCSHGGSIPSISVLDMSDERQLKWSLFASKAEIRRFQKYLKSKSKPTVPSNDDADEEFKGFEEDTSSFNKVMILGFMINDLVNKKKG